MFKIKSKKAEHAVLLKFKEGTTKEQINQCFIELKNLEKQIPGITYFSGGEYITNEGLNQGFKHGFIMKFKSVAALEAYLTNPLHTKVAEDIIEHLQELPDSVAAFNFKSHSLPTTRSATHTIEEYTKLVSPREQYETAKTMLNVNLTKQQLEILRSELANTINQIKSEPDKFSHTVVLPFFDNKRVTLSGDALVPKLEKLIQKIDNQLEQKKHVLDAGNLPEREYPLLHSKL